MASFAQLVSAAMMWLCSLSLIIMRTTGSHASHSHGTCLQSLSYDYIVVGAGSAGSALAARLASNSVSQATVLLIEEGGWSNQWPSVDDASLGIETFLTPQLNPLWTTTPQTGANGRQMGQPRGKATGGSGAIYLMDWVLGRKDDFDQRWNVDGWRWSDVSPYWDEMRSDWQTRTNQADGIVFRDEMLNSAQQNGYQYNPDFNDLNVNGQAGIAEMQFAAKDVSPELAEKLNSWKVYVEPTLRDKDNFDVLVYTRVNKVLLETCNDDKRKKKKKKKKNRHGWKASGVEIYGIGDGKTSVIRARKEVILCAGTLETPKLLMLSGIGDCDELQALDIECKQAVPGVGKNLHDDVQLWLTSPPLKKEIVDSLDKLPKNVMTFTNEQTMIVFDELAEFEHVWWLANFTDPASFFPLDELAFFHVVYLQHPVSRGQVTLADNDPASTPVIDPNYLGQDDDKEMLVEAIKTSRRLLYGDAMTGLYEGDSDEHEIRPGRQVQSDDELREWAIDNFLEGSHQVGTAKMSSQWEDDVMNVVDNRLRVRNIENLRIADCSIVPEIVTGHTNQVAVLIGLKGADLILQDHGDRDVGAY